MAHKNITQIVQNLSELLDAVEADTEKTTEKLENTKKKQKAFFEDFWYHVDSYYRDILFQYNRMREEGRTTLTVIVRDTEHHSDINCEINVSYLDRREAVYVSVKAYDRESEKMVNCITATESEDGVRIDYESSDLTRKKLPEAIQYIKSGQFDVDFAKIIQLKCMGILEKNEELRKSA